MIGCNDDSRADGTQAIYRMRETYDNMIMDQQDKNAGIVSYSERTRLAGGEIESGSLFHVHSPL